MKIMAVAAALAQLAAKTLASYRKATQRENPRISGKSAIMKMYRANGEE